MSQESLVVDPFEFARDSRRFDRSLAVAAFSRLAGEVARQAGSLRVVLQGEQGRDGKFYLLVSVEGSLWLGCQRCLEPMEWPCSLSARWLLVPKGQLIPDEELEEEAFDAVEVEGRQDLIALVEDEILLGLPVSPRHDVCAAPSPVAGESRESPFAGLASLRGAKGSV